MSKDNFDFTGYPKLGRPFVSGSKRDRYIKFYLTPDELLSFEKLEKNLTIYYASKGYLYNRSVHFRNLLNFIDDVRILNVLFENLPDEIQMFKISSPIK